MKKMLLIILFMTACLAAVCQKDNRSKKRTTGFTISLPWATNYQFYHQERNKDSSLSGFVGIGLAFFTKAGENKLSFNTGLTADLPVPMGPVDIRHDGDFAQIGALFFEPLFHRTIVNKINVIGGINYTAYLYRFTHFATATQYKKTDHTIGLTVGAEYIFKRSFAVAAFYRPALFSLDHKSYKHLLGLDLRFDINIWKKS